MRERNRLFFFLLLGLCVCDVTLQGLNHTKKKAGANKNEKKEVFVLFFPYSRVFARLDIHSRRAGRQHGEGRGHQGDGDEHGREAVAAGGGERG